MTNSTILQLPAPESSGGRYLVAAVSEASGDLVSIEQAGAAATEMTETIGMGAISRSGAIQSGERQGWIKFAEEKLKRDAQLDYQVTD